jgi:hypothetical protein
MWMHLLQLCDVVNEHTLCCRQPHKSAMRMTLLRKDGKPRLAWNREMQNNVHTGLPSLKFLLQHKHHWCVSSGIINVAEIVCGVCGAGGINMLMSQNQLCASGATTTQQERPLVYIVALALHCKFIVQA